MGKTKLTEISCSKAPPSQGIAEPVLVLFEANACSLNHWMMLLSVVIKYALILPVLQRMDFYVIQKLPFKLIDSHFFVVILYSLGVSSSFKRLSSFEWKHGV